MDPKVSFGDLNSGLQIGFNYGPVNLNLDELLPVVDQVAFDSFKDQHEHKCLPGTRTDILLQIKDWAFSPRERCIFWLNGAAGTGKSTIARTVATSFNETKILGASFFFKRGEGDRGNALKLFPTIARQLAIRIRPLLPAIQQAVQDDPAIATKAMKDQFDKLVLQPLLSIKPSDIPNDTLVIVIDALDECEGDNDVRLILQLLPQLQKSRSIRVRVFLTSRPELPIRLGFSKIEAQDHRDMVLHTIPEGVIRHDISLFLNHRLAEIRTELGLPIDWPGETTIKKLVKLSVPLFIFAATICRVFEDRYWDPRESLAEILSHQDSISNMDRTYLPVLDRILLAPQNKRQKKQLIQDFQQVVGSIVLLESPLSIVSLSRLLNVPETVIRRRLDPLHSVLIVPDNDSTVPVRLFHVSFRDFLVDPEIREKTPFWVDEKAMHHKLAIQCLATCQNLQKNICGLASDGTQRTEISRQAIDDGLPPELQYACRYWVHHLTQCADPESVMCEAFLFLEKHFLHWVEAMSLLGLVSGVVGMLDVLLTMVPNDQDHAISEFLQDAKRFILKNSQIADKAPLQIYCAGLIFAPKKSIIRTKFDVELPTWICQFPRVEDDWSAEFQTLKGHSGSVESVALSPNGLLASGSGDKTIRLWDTATGTLQLIIEGHSNWVRSVAFSIDGRLLASGSDDRTVRLWNMATGALQQTLEGHSDSVESVALSSNGLLASGSGDRTVRIWNIATGTLQLILEGHSNRVHSVAFSTDGRLLASGSGDKTIRLWDTMTGALRRTFKGHSGSVQSVAISCNGLLASGSSDRTIGLWSTATGAVQQSFEGHCGSVESVAFSPDGRVLAFSPGDQSIRLLHIDSQFGYPLSVHSKLINETEAFYRCWECGIVTNTKHVLKRHVSHSHHPEFVYRCHYKDCTTLKTPCHHRHKLLDHYRFFHGGVPSSDIINNKRELLPCPPICPFCSITIQTWREFYECYVFHCGVVPEPSEGNLSLPNGDDRGNQRPQVGEQEHPASATGTLQQTLEDHPNSVRSVIFSPDGRLLASGSGDKSIRHYTLESRSDWVCSMVFSPDGCLLASGSNDNTVCLWDTMTGVLQRTFPGSIGVFEFAQDGSCLITSLGAFDIPARNESQGHIPGSTHGQLDISIDKRQWVKLNGKHILWLPLESRVTCSEIFGNVLALGHASGQVSFLGFCL